MDVYVINYRGKYMQRASRANEHYSLNPFHNPLGGPAQSYLQTGFMFGS
jgi:hypothetical protein